MERIAAEPRITLLTGTEVSSVKRAGQGFENSPTAASDCARPPSCTRLTATSTCSTRRSACPLHTYQYELCEMPVARTPWARAGWSVIDGPFFGVMPYGFANDYLLYDVELSVLERNIGTLPEFKHDIAGLRRSRNGALRPLPGLFEKVEAVHSQCRSVHVPALDVYGARGAAVSGQNRYARHHRRAACTGLLAHFFGENIAQRFDGAGSGRER